MICAVACEKDQLEYQKGDINVKIEKGDNYLHDFPLFMGLNKKNPPQMAVWVEDMQGNYLSTLYVTFNAGTQGWKSAGNNRRKESLPHWCHQRGVKYSDGLYLPTKDEPITDAVTGATPKGSFDVLMRTKSMPKTFVVKVEVNHSIDWNYAYPEDATPNSPNYSGGSEGSGQPAVVYYAIVDLDSGADTFEAVYAGHSSPDGSNGELIAETEGITTALNIVKQITVTIK